MRESVTLNAREQQRIAVDRPGSANAARIVAGAGDGAPRPGASPARGADTYQIRARLIAIRTVTG